MNDPVLKDVLIVILTLAGVLLAAALCILGFIWWMVRDYCKGREEDGRE